LPSAKSQVEVIGEVRRRYAVQTPVGQHTQSKFGHDKGHAVSGDP